MTKFSDFVIYVDESGDHRLDRIDPQYSIFVLSFCIFRKTDYISTIVPLVQDFKFQWFGHDAIILHEREIRKQTPPFKFLQNRNKRDEFMTDISRIMDDSQMTIIASVIDKTKHRARYRDPISPYEIALLFCMERVYRFLKDNDQLDKITHCLFEKRGRKEDAELELQFRRIADGANYLEKRLDCLESVFVDKKANSSGLQIADLTARPIGLKILRKDQPNRAYEIIHRKLRTGPNGPLGWGLKIFP